MSAYIYGYKMAEKHFNIKHKYKITFSFYQGPPQPPSFAILKPIDILEPNSMSPLD